MNNTLKFFNEITSIPRPSGHEEKIRDYLVSFAKERNLECYTDKTLNVIIKKPSNCNKNSTLILQAHTDMVCEKDNNAKINFLTDPIKTIVDGDFLKAQGTTLGADNGVGLSMILSLLDDNSIKIPHLECVFTSQEETTMQGAFDIDTTLLKGKHLLSIDGTDEAQIEVSSAGMAVVEAQSQFNVVKASNIKDSSKLENISCYKISINGFRGGHSGTEINSNRQNAIIVMFEFLKTLSNIRLVQIYGGGKSNAIPRECSAIVLTQNLEEKQLKMLANAFIKDFEYIEPNSKILIEKIKNSQCTSLDLDTTQKLINFISGYKNGVLVWSKDIKSFPIVSNNFANIQLSQNGKLNIIISVRSSDKSLEDRYLADILEQLKETNISAEITSRSPFFEQKQNSYLQKLCVQEYKKLYNKVAEIKGVHAGLEGGVFAGKIPNIDICVIAPNIYDAHSPMERVSLSSINRVYAWLEKIVENF